MIWNKIENEIWIPTGRWSGSFPKWIEERKSKVNQIFNAMMKAKSQKLDKPSLNSNDLEVVDLDFIFKIF